MKDEQRGYAFVSEAGLRRIFNGWRTDAEWHLAKYVDGRTLLSIPQHAVTVSPVSLREDEIRDRPPDRCARVSGPFGAEVMHACLPGTSACECGMHLYPPRAAP